MALDEVPEHLAGHACAPTRDKQRFAALPLQDVGARLRQVALQPGMRLGAKRHQAFTCALAHHTQHTLVQPQVHRLGLHQFAHTQAAGVHQLDHRAIPQSQRRVHVGRGQQRFDLGFRQRLGHTQRLARGLQAQRGVAAHDVLAQRPAKVALEDREPPIRRGGARGGMALAHEGQQVGLGAGLQQLARCVLQPGCIQAQVTPVSGQRQCRQPVLDPQRVDEAVDRGLAGRRPVHSSDNFCFTTTAL